MILIKKLFTHEDGKFFHSHKILGLLSLLNFTSYFVNFQHLNVQSNYYIYLLFVHTLLHMSSFEFILSNRRNTKYNIIWPEMRWHSMIFAYRSLIIMALFRYKNYINTIFALMRFIVVILTMLSADIVTHLLPQNKNGTELTTMRGNPYPDNTSQIIIKSLNLFYSISQVFATLHMLFSPTPDYVFLTLFPIQTAPFFMTLQRKGFITQFTWHALYTFAILTNYIYSAIYIYEPIMSWVFMFYFVCYRFHFKINKYYLWTSIFISYYLLKLVYET